MNEESDIPIEPTLQDIATHLRYARQELRKIDRRLEDQYVKKAEFAPVRNLVFGFAGMLLMGVLIAVGRLLWGHFSL